MSIELIKTAHAATSVSDDSVDTDAIADDAVTYAKIQNVSATDRILGRDSASAGVIEEISPANLLTMLGVEAGADVTDATNVTAAGALMDSELAGIAAVKATTGTFLSADESKLDGIEASATADQTAGEILTLLEDGVDSVHYKDNSVDAVHLFDLARGSLLIGNASAATAELTVGSDNQVLTVDASGDIGWEAASAGGISTTLADGNILVGNGSNVAASVNPSGDVDVTNAGVFSIASGVVVDADVNASAAIAVSKTALTAGTNISLSTNTLNVDDAFLKNDANDTTTGIITSGGLVLSEAASVSIGTPLLPSTDHTYSGMSAEMLAGGAIGAQDLVCIHTTTQEVVVADASAVATARAIGIAPAAISDTATGTVLLQGFIRDDTWAWTTGGVLYLSETAGDLTQTAPTTDGAFVQVVGIALSPDVAYINPSMDIIEHA